MHILDCQGGEQSSHAKHRHWNNRKDNYNEFVEIPELFEVAAFLFFDLQNLVDLFFNSQLIY